MSPLSKSACSKASAGGSADVSADASEHAPRSAARPMMPARTIACGRAQKLSVMSYAILLNLVACTCLRPAWVVPAWAPCRRPRAPPHPGADGADDSVGPRCGAARGDRGLLVHRVGGGRRTGATGWSAGVQTVEPGRPARVQAISRPRSGGGSAHLTRRAARSDGPRRADPP